MSPRIEIVAITATQLRKMFNEADYPRLVREGEFTIKILSEGFANPKYHQPPGTKSQLIAYYDAKGRERARAHQYVLKDGSLGGGGKPDPKKVFQYPYLYVVR